VRRLSAPLTRLMRPLRQCQRAATAVEYGLIVALIVLAIMASLNSLATKTTGMWNNVSTSMK
jgi:pilus assembly protein Flp/PilA